MNVIGTPNALLMEAIEFLSGYFSETGKTEEELLSRIEEVTQEIDAKGYYTHTFEELEHGARMAWRNNNRCIGRLFWNTLTVFDERKRRSAEAIFQALLAHIEFATNSGKIRPSITIFAPQMAGQDQARLWNHQLIRYAGYEKDGEIIGDSSSLEFTRQCEKLGWQGAGTPFDVLPIVIETATEAPRFFELPKEVVLEVELEHPDWPNFKDLGAKWYAVPIISEMKLEIGGIHYTLAPFNGWYMGTEIGARNLADEDRYHLLPKVAEVMGLDMSSNRSLWKDKALVELNVAVLESFQQAGVTIVDHHTAAKQFKNFEKKEAAAERDVTGNWAWLIPPMSPATTHIFHKPYKNDIVKPNYFYQKPPYL